MQASAETLFLLSLLYRTDYSESVNSSPSKKRNYILTLTVVSGLILLLGIVFRPQQRLAEVPPSETDMARLVNFTERRSLETRSGYFAMLADEAAGSVVRLPDIAASGVVWTIGTIATARQRPKFPDTTPVNILNENILASGAVWTPSLPVAGIRWGTAPAAGPASRPTSVPRAGDWILAVWRTDQERVFAPGNFQESAPVFCDDTEANEVLSTIAFTKSMTGGGLFNMDGDIIGLILPCGQRYAAIVPDRVDAMLTEAESFAGRLLARYGVAVGPLSDDESKYFAGVAGVIVREVWAGFSAQDSDVRPGDLIVALNGETVARTEDLQPLLVWSGPESPVLSVLRHGQSHDISLSDNMGENAPRVDETQAVGLAWEPTREGYPIDSVLPNSPAADAGIKPGDRLLRIELAEPRSLEQARRLLDKVKTAPVFVEIQRGNRRWVTLLKPGAH